jgi:hypothetical protein
MKSRLPIENFSYLFASQKNLNMKTKILMLSVLMAFFLAFGFTSCSSTPAEDTYKVGTHVAAKWSDGEYWGATVTGNAGGKYQVKYDDGTEGEVTAADMKSITPQAEIKVGDKVLGVWMTNGKMYKGTVQELQAGGAIVKWDDGSEPSLVAFSNITK